MLGSSSFASRISDVALCWREAAWRRSERLRSSSATVCIALGVARKCTPKAIRSDTLEHLLQPFGDQADGLTKVLL